MKEKKIVVAHVIGKWVGGGVESVVMNYYKNIDRRKVQFDFICDEDSTNIPYDEIQSMGGRVIIVPPYQDLFKYRKAIINVCRKNKYKIIHSHINTLSVFPLSAAKRAGVPIRIAHSHSTSNKKEWKKDFLKNILKPFSKLYATHYMCCSELAGRWLFGNKCYENKKVYLLNNAIDLEKFNYNEEIRIRKRSDLGISDDTIVIGHIGRFVEQKNHEFLIEVYKEIDRLNNNTILLLAGIGPLYDEIKNKVRMLGLDNKVMFLGQRDDVNELYQVFDVFVLPSLYEGLPVVGVEAQSTGNLCFFSKCMTKETKILDSTIFMGIDEPAYDWANSILNRLKTFRKRDFSEEITKYGFNIKKEVKKLENKYIELIHEFMEE